MTHAVTRRDAIKAIAVVGAGAAALGLAGCSGGDQQQAGSYLPLGSVVQLEGYSGTPLCYMIINRRPHVVKELKLGSSGEVDHVSTDAIYDYVGVPWPFAKLTDYDSAKDETAPIARFFNAEAIAEVRFTGYVDDLEKEAAAALEAAKESGTSNADALGSMAARISKEVQEKAGN